MSYPYQRLFLDVQLAKKRLEKVLGPACGVADVTSYGAWLAEPCTTGPRLTKPFYDGTTQEPAGVLHDLIVEPEHRGRGVGRLLLNAVLTHLTTRGAPRVVLLAAEGNQAAQRLFASMGFRRTMAEMTRELEEATRMRRP